MRNNGGFLLIKIDKLLAYITADDFDKKIFRKCCENGTNKQLILQTKDGSYIFGQTSCESNSFYAFISLPYIENGSVESLTQIELSYNYTTDTLTFSFVEL